MATNYDILSDSDNEWNNFTNSLSVYDCWAYCDILLQKITLGKYKEYSFEYIIEMIDQKSSQALDSLRHGDFKIEQKMKFMIPLVEMRGISIYINSIHINWKKSQETDFLDFLELEKEREEEFLEKLQRFDVLARSIE
jgi:hypothetical protein